MSKRLFLKLSIDEHDLMEDVLEERIGKLEKKVVKLHSKILSMNEDGTATEIGIEKIECDIDNVKEELALIKTLISRLHKVDI